MTVEWEGISCCQAWMEASVRHDTILGNRLECFDPLIFFSCCLYCGTRSDLWAQQVVVCGKEQLMLQESVMNYLLLAIAL